MSAPGLQPSSTVPVEIVLKLLYEWSQTFRQLQNQPGHPRESELGAESESALVSEPGSELALELQSLLASGLESQLQSVWESAGTRHSERLISGQSIRNARIHA